MNDTNPTNPTDNPVTDSAVGDGDNKPAEAPAMPAGDEPADDTNKPA